MIVTQKLNMDMSRQGVIPRIGAVQGDSGTRAVEITLFCDGVPWSIPDDATAAVAFKKPDGTAGLYDTMPDGMTSAVTVSGNVLTALLAPQMLAVPGLVIAAVVIFSGTAQLATFLFSVAVSPNPAAGSVVSNNYYYFQTFGEINEAIGNLNDLDTTDKSSLVAAVNEVLSVVPVIKSAAVGQTIVVAGVDDSGKPIKWRAAAFPAYSQNTNCVKTVANISPDKNGNIPMDWVATKTMQPLVILEETAVTPGFNKVLTYDMLEGQDELAVTFDGRLYICVPRFSYSEGDGYSVEFGNLALAGIDTADTGEPFYVWGYKGVKSMSFTFETSGEHAMSVTGSGFEYNPLPQEYLPQTVPVIQAAKAGQVVLIKAVNEKGVPTDWEAIDLPDGSQNGNDGEDGGYYTPAVTQVDENTMKVSFSASKEGMAAAADQEITLPAGPAGRDGRDGQPGADGSPGADGLPGKDGQDGSDGITPHIGDNGNWFIGDTDTGIPSRGKAGADGKDGLDGKDGEPGKNGADGQPGKDGTSPVVSVSTITGGHRITITDANDTKYVDVMDGSNGKGGVDGADGTSVTVKSVNESTSDGGSNVVTFSDGNTITIKNGKTGAAGKDGAKGADGYTPVRGTDYWTPADQEDIVQQVIIALGTPVFGTVDTANNITLSGELVEGTYTLRYEDAEGNLTEIGTIDIGAVLAYTNLADPTSADWLTGIRLNSSGAETASAGAYTTNYIPLKQGDVVRIRGLNIYYNSSTGMGNATTWFFDESKTRVASIVPRDHYNTFGGVDTVEPDKDFVYTVANSATFLSGDASQISYARFVGRLLAGYTVEDVIITVNEEITE